MSGCSRALCEIRAARLLDGLNVARRSILPGHGSKSPMYTRIFRFAPSPNGYLHLGHAYSALLNDDMAREAGGRLLLRIEDIDAARCRPEYEAAIYEDLHWLGIAWQQNVRRQSEHFDDYQAAVAKLEAMGSSIRVSRAAARSPRLSPSASGRGIGRAIPTACRFIPAARAKCRGPNASAGAARVSRSHCGSPWTRRWRAPAC